MNDYDVAMSHVDEPVMETPTGFKAVWNSHHEAVQFTWDNNAEVNNPDFGSYRVYRRVMSEYSLPIWIAETLHSYFVDIPAAAEVGISYYYSVSAVHKIDWIESAPCTEILVTLVREEQ